MKILILSDSHNNTKRMLNLFDMLADKIDMALHLGDCIEDILAMQKKYPHIPMQYVAGNCDMKHTEPKESLVEAAGKRIFMAHGHRLDVKYSAERLVYAALEQQAHICLYGHTHAPARFVMKDILFFNPGSITFPRGISMYPSYGILNIEGDEVSAEAIAIAGDAYKVIKLP